MDGKPALGASSPAKPAYHTGTVIAHEPRLRPSAMLREFVPSFPFVRSFLRSFTVRATAPTQRHRRRSHIVSLHPRVISIAPRPVPSDLKRRARRCPRVPPAPPPPDSLPTPARTISHARSPTRARRRPVRRSPIHPSSIHSFQSKSVLLLSTFVRVRASPVPVAVVSPSSSNARIHRTRRDDDDVDVDVASREGRRHRSHAPRRRLPRASAINHQSIIQSITHSHA